MAYKVLGQVSPAAPSGGTTINNYVKDSSFEAYSFSSYIYAASTSTCYAINSATPWRWSPNSNSAYPLTNTLIEGTTPAFGSMSYGVNGPGWITQGLNLNYNPSSTPSSGYLDTATAIPVSASTTYYVGWSYRNNSEANTMNFMIYWFDSNGGYLSSTSKSQSIASAATWYRYNSSVSSPANAAYAYINFYVGGGTWFIDGVVLGPSSSYASTYTEPLLPSVAAATAPYDKKFNGYLTESYLANSGTANAGALSTLYTVPADKSAVVSTLVITNLGNATTYRVAVIPSGDTLSQENWVFFDTAIGAKSTQTITIGMTLATGDVVKVSADSGYTSATLFGSES